jgi:hypothetical protein
MRISIRSPEGVELDNATVSDPKRAANEAAFLLSSLARIYPGTLLIFDDDRPAEQASPITVTPAHVRSLMTRLEARSRALESARPEDSADMRLAARLFRHFERIGWIGKCSIAMQ